VRVEQFESLILFVSDLAVAKAFYVGALGVWPVQEATWGRFLVVANPDGRSVVLAKMRSIATSSPTGVNVA
jgi:hypothetical protein